MQHRVDSGDSCKLSKYFNGQSLVTFFSRTLLINFQIVINKDYIYLYTCEKKKIYIHSFINCHWLLIENFSYLIIKSSKPSFKISFMIEIF